jgi:glucosyl-dolichyl phosphate glucuronosyltransferase
MENIAPQKPLQISVIICTYNRCDRLFLALEALAQQTLPQEKFEILVIDNRSTDSTAAVCESFSKQLKNFKYIYEPVQGLSRARNTGWRSARSPFVAYLDDDAIPCKEWIESILASFQTLEPMPVSVGGPIEPLWEIPRPDWITPVIEELFTILDGGDVPRWFGKNEYPWGANVAYRLESLKKVDGFCEQLGRNGQSLLSGEESFLNSTLKAQGGEFYYNPQALVSHWVPKERINPEWLVKRSYWQGFSVALVDKILGRPSYYQRLSSLWNLFKRTFQSSSVVIRFLIDSKFRSQISLLDQIKIILAWQWGYFSKVWFSE